MNISNKEARQIILKSQLLESDHDFTGKKDLLQIIKKLGYIQIDTISVVERAHHHILWTRMNNYKRTMLHELMEKDKKIFEYWSHAAAFLPIENFRFSLYKKKRFKEKYEDWFISNKKILKFVLDRIKNEGALMSKDFEHTGSKTTGWWDRKPAKAALEALFMSGELMICKREGFQKTYDLTERVFKKVNETSIPSESEYFEHLLFTSINAYGITTAEEAAYLRGINRKVITEVINKLLEENKIKILNIKGSDIKYYTSKKNLKLIADNTNQKVIHILSPFDNLIIQRKRLKNLFGFNYFLECYLPQAKRKYGYFSMPVLIGEKFKGTIDAKADRTTNTFEIRSMHLSKLKRNEEQMLRNKIKKLSEFTLNKN